MNRVFCIFSICILIAGCSGVDRIDISNIRTRSQIDAIIASLPADSLQIDSSANRSIRINLKGNFLLHNYPVNNLLVMLERDSISSISVGSDNGLLTILNSIENTYGLGGYDNDFSNRFEWEIPFKSISLKPEYSSWSEDYFNLSDSTSFWYREQFLPSARNKITDISREIELSETFPVVGIYISEYGPDFDLTINGILIDGSRIYEGFTINEYLSKGKEQEFTIEFKIPKDNLDRRLAYYWNTETGETLYRHVELILYSEQKNKVGKRVIAEVPFDTQELLNKRSSTVRIELPELATAFDYSQCADLRKIPDIKERIYALYSELNDAVASKDMPKITDLLYPAVRLKALAYNWGEPELQEYYSDLLSYIEDNDGWDFYAKEDVDVVFYNEGRCAILQAKPHIEHDSALVIYGADDHSRHFSYSVFIDESGKMQFGTLYR